MSEVTEKPEFELQGKLVRVSIVKMEGELKLEDKLVQVSTDKLVAVATPTGEIFSSEFSGSVTSAAAKSASSKTC